MLLHNSSHYNNYLLVRYDTTYFVIPSQLVLRINPNDQKFIQEDKQNIYKDFINFSYLLGSNFKSNQEFAYRILCGDDDCQYYILVDEFVSSWEKTASHKPLDIAIKKDSLLNNLIFSLPWSDKKYNILWDLSFFLTSLQNCSKVFHINYNLFSYFYKFMNISAILQQAFSLFSLSDHQIFYGDIIVINSPDDDIIFLAQHVVHNKYGQEIIVKCRDAGFKGSKDYVMLTEDISKIFENHTKNQTQKTLLRLCVSKDYSETGDSLKAIKNIANMVDVYLQLQFDEDIKQKAFDSIIDNVSEGVLLLHSNLLVHYGNKIAKDMLKIHEDVIEGQSLETVIGTVNDSIIEACQDAIKNKESQTLADQIYFTPDDESFAFDIKIHYLNIRGDERIIVIISSIEEKRKTQDLINRYIGVGMSQEVIEKYNYTTRNMTVLFNDVKGFTSLVEKLGPKESLPLLNEYFTFMEDVITNNGGYIDKFIGDAIMAVFGMDDGDDYATKAVKTVQDMYRALHMFNKAQEMQGKSQINMRVGLATGPMIVGTIGSSRRGDFSVIGDTVNKGGRMVDFNKVYDSDILIDHETLERNTTPILSREICKINLRGQTKQTTVYQLSQQPPGENNPDTEFFETYNKALKYVEDKQYHEAKNIIASLLKDNPKDVASQDLIKHLEKEENTTSDHKKTEKPVDPASQDTVEKASTKKASKKSPSKKKVTLKVRKS